MFAKISLRIKSVDVRIALALILLWALALRLAFFVGMDLWDDYRYAQVAYSIMTRDFDPSNFAQFNTNLFRAGITVPVALSFRAFGINEYAAIAWPLLCSLASVALIFYLGRMFFDERAGLLAAMLLSFYPLDTVQSTLLLPDGVQPFFLALSVFTFLGGERADSTRTRVYHFGLSGLSLGVAFWVRESAFVVLLFYAAYAVYSRTLRREWIAIFIGLFSIFALDCLIYLWTTGDPFFHLRALLEFNARYHPVNFARVVNRPENPYVSWFMLSYYRMLMSHSHLMFFSFFTFISTVYLIIKKDRQAYVLILWFLLTLFFMEFIWPVFGWKLLRHLTTLTIPYLLVLARFLTTVEENYEGTKRRFISPAILCVLLLTSLFLGRRYQDFCKSQAYKHKTICYFLQSLPRKNVYLPEGSRWFGWLNFYLRYDTGYDLFGTREEDRNSILKSLDNMKYDQIFDSYVVIDEEFPHGGIPASWEELRRVEGATLYCAEGS